MGTFYSRITRGFLTISLAVLGAILLIAFTIGTTRAGFDIYLPIIIQNNAPKTWTSQTSGITTGLSGVSCPSPTTCFAVGSGGVIRVTTDGGTIWSGQTSGTTQNLNDVSCPSTTTCFAAGDNGTIVRTTTGGAIWSAQSSGTSDALRGISCPITSFCSAVGGNGRTTVTFTQDGNSWKAAVGVLSPNTPTAAVSCPDATVCVVVGDVGRLYAVTPQPALKYPALTLYPAPNSRGLRGVSCPAGSTTCFIVGEGGKLVASTNLYNPGSWAEQNSATANLLQDVSCPSTTYCYAVGANGTIRATRIGDNTWAGETSGTAVTLNDISCPDTGVCWAVGDSGTILKGQ